jgi:LysM repeat protein
MSTTRSPDPEIMRPLPTRRALVVAWPIALGAVLFAACGADDAGSPTRSTIDLSQGSTAFIVRPTTPSTTIAEEVAGEVTTNAQEYTVQAGDYPLAVATKFGVALDELVAFNGWASAGEFPFPGQTILIPPGGVVPGQEATDAATADAVEGSAEGEEAVEGDAVATETTQPGDTIPDAGDNCGEGTHTVVAGDYPLKVAEQYDVTIEALDAANATNPAYGQFAPGQTIIIPAKADC